MYHVLEAILLTPMHALS